MKSSVIFIRHGESLGNVDPSYYQHPDAAIILSPKGVQQALALKDQIHTYMDPDHYGVHTQVITSVIQRAKITADIVMSKVNLKLPILHDARLNEVYHSAHETPEENSEEIRARVLSLVLQYPFNLILFCHGMLMRDIDPAKGGARNCEVRKYDRHDLIAMLEKRILV
jgi:broad specificity phosphatase PhoE